MPGKASFYFLKSNMTSQGYLLFFAFKKCFGNKKGKIW